MAVIAAGRAPPRDLGAGPGTPRQAVEGDAHHVAGDETAQVTPERDRPHPDRDDHVDEDQPSDARDCQTFTPWLRWAASIAPIRPKTAPGGPHGEPDRLRRGARRTRPRTARRRTAPDTGTRPRPCSRGRPSCHSRNMLKPMWTSPRCRNALVKMRYHSPSTSTSRPLRPPSRVRSPKDPPPKSLRPSPRR